MLDPALQTIVDALVAGHPDGLTLDELADALAGRSVSYAETEAIIEALEEAGVSLDRSTPAAGGADDLAAALTAARALAAELGRAPTVDEIADRTGLTTVAVRRALVLGRG